jgi:hypothetical protein
MTETTMAREASLAAARSPLGFEPTTAHHTTGASWAAIFAGAVGAAALSLILLILGVGLGLSSVSPWSGQGINAETFGTSTILWLTFTQLAASGMGGSLLAVCVRAGRAFTQMRSTSVTPRTASSHGPSQHW